MTTTSTPTRGQIQRTLAQRIQALYREQLGHQPSKVTCQLSDSSLTIILENSITQPEQLLAQTGRQELAEQVRADLDEAIQPQLKTLIEDILNVEVVELLSDACCCRSKHDSGFSFLPKKEQISASRSSIM